MYLFIYCFGNEEDNDDDDDDSYIWLLIHYPFFQNETSELTNSL